MSLMRNPSYAIPRSNVREIWLVGSEPREWLDWLFNNEAWLRSLARASMDDQMSRIEMGQLMEESMEAFLESTGVREPEGLE